MENDRTQPKKCSDENKVTVHLHKPETKCNESEINISPLSEVWVRRVKVRVGRVGDLIEVQRSFKWFQLTAIYFPSDSTEIYMKIRKV